MKTFKLISLDVLEKRGDELTNKPIDLKDGLIINREDEQNHWLVEAYMNDSYKPFFQQMMDEKREYVLQVKISKESNEPATIMVKMVGINKIGESMNVLFKGTLLNRKQEKVEEMLQGLIQEGFQGAELLEKFKERSKQF
ncbi:YwpF-like protein [Salinibacillus kushneri]|uniref:YwpF-like protein n=1 Tax=Salinibacillus kushneri TaxID=237682 RepID=A0A1I0I9F8_9BACI|nr:YwpF-like family protein [Salinibacillus kushneri]SET93047.1 YwpF-like protein [Salinibacillus kushneri]